MPRVLNQEITDLKSTNPKSSSVKTHFKSTIQNQSPYSLNRSRTRESERQRYPQIQKINQSRKRSKYLRAENPKGQRQRAEIQEQNQVQTPENQNQILHQNRGTKAEKTGR